MLRFIALAALLAFSSLAEDTQPGRAKRQATRGPTVTTFSGSELSGAGAGLAGSGPGAAASSPSAAGSGSASASAAASPSAAGSGAEGKGSDKGKGSAIGDEDAYIANEIKKMDNAANAEIEVVNTLVDLLQEAGNVDVVISIDPVPVKANPLLYAKAALEDGEWNASKGEDKVKGKGKGKGVVDEGSGSGASSAASSGAGSAASSGASSAASTGASSAASSAAGSGAQAASLLETDIKPAKKAAGRSGESSASGSGQGSGSANKADTKAAAKAANTVAAAGSGIGSGSGTGKVEAMWEIHKGNHTGKGKDKGKGKDTEDASMIFGMDHSNLNATFEIHYNATDNETVAKMENIISRKKVNVAIKFQVPGPMMNLTGLVV